MDDITTLTSKGQVTIPKKFRDKLGLNPYDKIRFSLAEGEQGELRLRKAYLSLEEIAGSLPPLPVGMSIEEAIELAKDERAQELVAKLKSA